ncbi:MAG: hypothetical protein LUD77_09670 [Clostridiales bacterium]|nr:hypothetical protein [Clostridiales bacterium]
MGVFDFDCCYGNSGTSGTGCCPGKDVKDECLIAFKVYDFFRIQECLTSDVLGYAKAAEDIVIDETEIGAGDVIVPPAGASSVVIENLEIDSVNVLNKKKNTFRNGYYDVDLQFVFFLYTCVFGNRGLCYCLCSGNKHIYDKSKPFRLNRHRCKPFNRPFRRLRLFKQYYLCSKSLCLD